MGIIVDQKGGIVPADLARVMTVGDTLSERVMSDIIRLLDDTVSLAQKETAGLTISPDGHIFLAQRSLIATINFVAEKRRAKSTD